MFLVQSIQDAEENKIYWNVQKFYIKAYVNEYGGKRDVKESIWLELLLQSMTNLYNYFKLLEEKA